ncbi:PEP-CTERM sorting domain-containing protein [Duganella sp. SAP-35]|uniref:PEP-CTERM sorting domain-containing protein n=2 Tax=Duganella aceris TaxID=2703883 RepID=A0ABX0FJL5_9BURK|nr:PEP-CTERM sorting domain-containing protein [Duganella aceris]
MNTGQSLDGAYWIADEAYSAWWSGGFSSGDGSVLVPGEYVNTTTETSNPLGPYLNLTHPGINLSTGPTGSFHIYELTRAENGMIQSLAVTFSLHSVYEPAILTGALWYGSSLPYPISTPVPEPSTYAMFGLGLGLLGLMRRKRATS